MKIVVIIPTYNEAKNIAPLIDALQQVFAGIVGHDLGILVVDDTSPDGTGQIVREKMEDTANLHLVTGRKNGLGDAYIRGMTHAIDQLGAEAVVEMDADFSHDPGDLPRLIREMDAGADFVIGSRYVPGGSIPAEWSFGRKMNSKFGNIFARYIAGMHRVKDCTAGFRVVRSWVVREIELQTLRVKGYAFQIALLNRAMKAGAVVKEVPVDFVDRKQGETKLGIFDIVEFIVNAWWIRLLNSVTFIKFLLVGASGVLVNLGMFALLISLGVNKYVASPVAIELSIISNFLLNNRFTFNGRALRRSFAVKGMRFNAVSLLSLTISYSFFIVLNMLMPRVNPIVPQALSIIPATLMNYFLNVYWTFGERAKAAEKSDERAPSFHVE
jgi:dolichol-phosphate mannosyltransferase